MLFPTKIQESRYQTLRRSLRSLGYLFRGRDVLDFGGEALSVLPIYEAGARRVIATQPDRVRVDESNSVLVRAGHTPSIIHTGYEPVIPFGDASFDTVLANAVLEHIPQPRGAYIAEMWRVLRSGGHLIVNETPNKYLPHDFHTTKLPLINWLPSRLAHFVAEKSGRLAHVNDAWEASGWRGLGYFEMVAPIRGYTLIPERSNARHRILAKIGIPASILDPYPVWVLRKH